MGLSRRFLNLILNEPRLGVTSLCSIDLSRHELFYPPETLPPPALEVEQLTLPTTTFSFRGSRYVCLPVADRKVLCTDRSKHAFLFDAATRHVVTIPTRRAFKSIPVSAFVPSSSASGGGGDGDPDGTLFVMETWPDHERMRLEAEYKQFEAFVYRKTSKSSPAKSWHSLLLPPLPHLHNPKYWRINVGISFRTRGVAVLIPSEGAGGVAGVRTLIQVAPEGETRPSGEAEPARGGRAP